MLGALLNVKGTILLEQKKWKYQVISHDPMNVIFFYIFYIQETIPYNSWISFYYHWESLWHASNKTLKPLAWNIMLNDIQGKLQGSDIPNPTSYFPQFLLHILQWFFNRIEIWQLGCLVNIFHAIEVSVLDKKFFMPEYLILYYCCPPLPLTALMPKWYKI